MKITVLGCGSSMGTPAAGGFWGRCDPLGERNWRTRASILVQTPATSLLVDATYDMRTHLNRHPVKKLDGILLSHHHSDHVNGIDDARALAYNHKMLIDVYANAETIGEIERRWPYLFTASEIYTPFIRPNVIEHYQTFRVGDIDVTTFEQDHTACKSLGFRFGNFAYSVDVADLTEKSLKALKGVETWIVDAGSYQKEHPVTHANLKRVMNWVETLKPKMTYLTVLTTHMDYKTLCEELPPHIRPAHDGMEIDMETNLR